MSWAGIDLDTRTCVLCRKKESNSLFSPCTPRWYRLHQRRRRRLTAGLFPFLCPADVDAFFKADFFCHLLRAQMQQPCLYVQRRNEMTHACVRVSKAAFSFLYIEHWGQRKHPFRFSFSVRRRRCDVRQQQTGFRGGSLVFFVCNNNIRQNSVCCCISRSVGRWFVHSFELQLQRLAFASCRLRCNRLLNSDLHL